METSQTNLINHNADREKHMVALSSVLAAIFLTSIKIVVGLLTGSLGILSEAAHSGLDLVAAAVTYFAVRVSGQPPDFEHPYGHGKVENLSALFETMLLLLTCIWIFYEAIQRLFFKSVEVETSIWAFVIMAISIGIDFTRSRALARVAKKYDSQALEADALHFSTDIWSSSVVIAGLGLVWVAEKLGLGWLKHADAVAAMGVAGIVVYVSIQLGKRAIDDLLDAIPPGIRESVIEVVRKVPGVEKVYKVRVRRSGPEYFADITLLVSSESSIETAHSIASQAEKAVIAMLPSADVLVNVIPSDFSKEGPPEKTPGSTNGSRLYTIRDISRNYALGVHGIRIYDVMGHQSLEMHVEVKDNLLLAEAHSQVSAFEDALRQSLPGLTKITTHIEPIGEATATRQVTPADKELILQVLQTLPEETGLICNVQNIEVRTTGEELMVSFDCIMDPNMEIVDAHSVTEQIERRLRTRIPSLGRVVIHVEPGMATQV